MSKDVLTITISDQSGIDVRRSKILLNPNSDSLSIRYDRVAFILYNLPLVP